MQDSKPIILIVDDEVDLLDVTASFLDMEGFSVLTAGGVKAALEILKTVKPDLIMSDITMPELTGFDLYESVRQTPSLLNVPFIFVSGHNDPDHIKTGKELGSDDYITKPFNPVMLVSTIKGKLKRHQQISESLAHQFDQMKSQLFHMLSHEMRTPLTSILGATEVLSDGEENLSSKDLKDFLEMLKSGSKRLNNLVEDFLLVVKIDSGDLVLEKNIKECVVAPRAIIGDLVKDLSETIHNKEIRQRITLTDVSLHFGIPLPHLEGILRRLLNNAVKFSPEGKEIRIEEKMDDSSYTFSITDQGPGISKAAQGGLFQKFHQINRAKQEQQGAGLGLYIARRLAETNNCTVWCESDEGAGATFYLTLPKL
jgi:two-component system, sensor histidine kinase and response regulator